MKLLVTGAAGFIGSTYVRLVRDEHEVTVLDKLTYAGRRENLPEGVELVVGAIEDPAIVREAMEGADAVVNFAAESHVDRSIDDQDAFARTHVIGTGVLLDAARELGVGRYLQVSTDEVYGSIESGSFTETSPLDPSSPYSATKAAGDLLVSAHAHTYGIEAVICRGSNNYGPRQYPEKLIPLTILNALHGDALPVYGDGRQVRNWLYVEDFCRGIHTVLMNGRPGEAYNVGGPDECENIEVVKRVIELTGAEESLIEYVQGPPRPRPPLLAGQRQDPRRAGLGGAGAFRRGPGADRCLVPRQRGVVGADPLRRVPRVLREAVRQEPELMPRAPARRRSTASSCSSPRSTATSAASWSRPIRRDTWAELGVERRVRPAQPLALGARHPARPPLPDRAGPGEAGPLPARVDLRRRRRPAPRLAHLRPVGGPRPGRREAPPALRPGSASATASRSSATSPTSPTCSPAPTTRLTEAGIAWDDPEVGVDWGVAEPLLSERDRTAPKLAEVADTLPFSY